MGSGYIAVIIRKYGEGFVDISLGNDLKDSHSRGHMKKKTSEQRKWNKILNSGACLIY